VDAATPAQGDAEEVVEALGDFPVGEPGLLVEFDDGSLGIGPQLGSGGPEGVGRLQGMAPLNPTAALTTLPDVDVELAVNGLARDRAGDPLTYCTAPDLVGLDLSGEQSPWNRAVLCFLRALPEDARIVLYWC
jgi:hypothetical protein